MVQITIEPGSKAPLYKQLVNQIERSIRNGRMKPGTQLSSMNELAEQYRISKETVKKAYGILCDKGLVSPKQGKGFYVNDISISALPKILVLFDKLSVYKQILFNAFKAELSGKAEVTILTHDQRTELLKYYLDNCLDQYDFYVIAPHFPLDSVSQSQAMRQLSRIPNRKLIMIDRLQPGYPGHFGAVYQDFENDIYYGLTQGMDGVSGTIGRMRVITLPSSLYGVNIRVGVQRFCTEHSIPLEFLTSSPDRIRKGDVFLVLNSQLDAGLVSLARRIQASGLSVGTDVRIISYNESDMNELVLGGLTTVSADFAQMGRVAARMILDKNLTKIHCDFRMIRRKTF